MAYFAFYSPPSSVNHDLLNSTRSEKRQLHLHQYFEFVGNEGSQMSEKPHMPRASPESYTPDLYPV